MSPTKRDGSGLTNAEQKIVRGFEYAVLLKEEQRQRLIQKIADNETADCCYDRARAKLVALIRQNRPTPSK